MARRVAFDATERESFVERRQRFDYRLLLNGFVHRVADVQALGRIGGLLRDAGYVVHELDARAWTSEGDVHDALAAALSFPSYYGRNLDAFNDVLRDVAEFEYGSDPASTGTAVLIDDYDRVYAVASGFAVALADIFAWQARYAALLGHPMLLLLRTDADLGPLGGMSPMWTTIGPPPPSAPPPTSS